MFISSSGSTRETLIFIHSSASAMYRPKYSRSVALVSSGSGRAATQLSMSERHCVPSSAEMYRMPARETVAGVAKRRSRISKIMRMYGFSGMRSLEASVSMRLSSITEFMDSIQLASRSPSSMIHLGFSFSIWPRSRMILDSSPSFHSRVAMEMYPYSSSVFTDLGLMSVKVVLLSGLRWLRAAISVRQHWDLPAAGGPITNTQCRMAASSSSCTTFSLNTSSGWLFSSRQPFST